MKFCAVILLSVIIQLSLKPYRVQSWFSRRRRSPPPPRPCKYTSWSSWSRCSRACNNVGRAYKTRKVDTWAAWGGKACHYKDLEDSKPCVGEWPCKGPKGSTKCTDFRKPGTPVCYCESGFHFVSKNTCAEEDECAPDGYGSSYCKHLCVNTYRSFYCKCRKGYKEAWKGSRYCNDINECTASNSPKGPCHQKCTNNPGSFTCNCLDGYKLQSDGLNCKDIDECSSKSTHDCDHICKNLPGGFSCDCKAGYALEGDKKSCKDIDECSTSRHSCQHTCINEVGSYKCSCNMGYALKADGRNCKALNLCLLNNGKGPGPCHHKCINLGEGAYKCSCESGYGLEGDGKTCHDVDECKSSPCSHICLNTAGSYECSCHPGYKKDEKDIKLCRIQDCKSPSFPNCPPGFDYLYLCHRVDFSCPQGTTFQEKCTLSCQLIGFGPGRVANEHKNFMDAMKQIDHSSKYETTCSVTPNNNNVAWDIDVANFYCGDENECKANNSKGPCDQICRNVPGSFYCECEEGYRKTDFTALTCTPGDCGSLKPEDCPSDSYEDSFSKACNNIVVKCPSGTTYKKRCSFSCSSGYQVAKITIQYGKGFSEDYSKVNFNVEAVAQCVMKVNVFSEEEYIWSTKKEMNSYFCRRVNDPPIEITLSSNSLAERSPIGFVIGKLTSTDPQSDQSFTYTVITNSKFFSIEGDSLKNQWKNPSMHSDLLDDNSSIDVTIRSSDNGNPPMWKDKVFTIQVTDFNECYENKGRGPCDHICFNLIGSYRCDCEKGYKLIGRHTCKPKDCGPLKSPVCPLNSYADKFSKACDKISFSCPSGTTYKEICSTSCNKGYQVAKISQQVGHKFGEDFKMVNFSVELTAKCLLHKNGGGVAWNIVEKVNSYFCRRVNDPPIEITLSSNSLAERSPIGFVIGKLASTDPQSDQSFTYTVITNSKFFSIEGDSLKNQWKNPSMHSDLLDDNSSIDVTIRSSDNGNPPMWKDKVFTIQVTDFNECYESKGRGPCDHICFNLIGSYRCDCEKGYKLTGRHTCKPKDCGPLKSPVCPLDSYADKFSKACDKISFSCPSGTTYKEICSTSCNKGYQVAKISQQVGHKFGEDFKMVNFSVELTAKCLLHKNGGGVAWNIVEKVNSYFCRRVNDPPIEITLSSNSLAERSPIGFVIGKLASTDPQSDQSFTYTVITNSKFFSIEGDSLKNQWKNPSMHSDLLDDNSSIDVTIRSSDNGNPPMWKDKVFTIQVTDFNECYENKGRGPCDHSCFNLIGSYRCDCEKGYKLTGRHTCKPKDCGPLKSPVCPLNSYADKFSKACDKISFSCPSGTTYKENCSTSCNKGYQVAKISQQVGHKFGEDFKMVNFSLELTAKCLLHKSGDGVAWNIAEKVNSYFCRRVNDPPVEITLSSNSLAERSPIGFVIGKLASTDPQSDQSFTYTVITNSKFFSIEGDSLKNQWKNPSMHSDLLDDNSSIDVTIRSSDNGNPPMWKDKVFTIQVTDFNECYENKGRGPCDHICFNLIGFYRCDCEKGYKLIGRHTCKPKDCGPLKSPVCPLNSYADKFSKACDKISFSCPSGTTYKESCNTSCNKGYQVAKISQQVGHKFGEDFKMVNFSLELTAKCLLHKSGDGVAWNIAEKVNSYFCRRVNDPPIEITLSSNSLAERSPIGFVIGKLTSTDPQSDQSFTYTVITNSKFFSIEGDSLKNQWKNPSMHSDLLDDNSSIDVTIRSSDNGNPPMWKDKVFTIQVTDFNECYENKGRGPCDHICFNLIGSYRCDCEKGYKLTGRHTCKPKDCGPLKSPECPPNSYEDSFSMVCNQVTVSCPSGTTYNESCTLSCSTGYRVGKIITQDVKEFGKSYKSTDFSVKPSAKCSLLESGDEVAWNIVQKIKSYYCRRLNDPPIEISLSSNYLAEHSPIGFVIGRLASTDQQSDQSYNYAVLTNSELFTTQGDRLKNLWGHPDLFSDLLDDDGTINVTIRSTDDGTPPMWKDRIFTIKVTDLNEPLINITLSNNNVYENSRTGTIIGNLTAKDLDDPPEKPPSSEYVWSLIEGGSGMIALEGPLVVVNRTLNYEIQKLYNITVFGTDHGTPPLTTIQDFSIHVLDSNDYPESLSLSSTSIDENSPKGTIVGTLLAMDEDRDPISFSISRSPQITQSKFELSEANCNESCAPKVSLNSSCVSTGLKNTSCDPIKADMICKSVCEAFLKVKGELDYEERPLYQLIVVASDHRSETVKEWTLNIVDVNEEPIAINLTGSHELYEDAPNGTIVGRFVITDPDNINNNHQSHECVIESGDTGYIVIENSTVLSVAGLKKLNFDEKKELNFSVTCTDDGKYHLPLSKTERFVVNVKEQKPQELDYMELVIRYGPIIPFLMLMFASFLITRKVYKSRKLRKEIKKSRIDALTLELQQESEDNGMFFHEIWLQEKSEADRDIFFDALRPKDFGAPVFDPNIYQGFEAVFDSESEEETEEETDEEEDEEGEILATERPLISFSPPDQTELILETELHGGSYVHPLNREIGERQTAHSGINYDGDMITGMELITETDFGRTTNEDEIGQDRMQQQSLEEYHQSDFDTLTCTPEYLGDVYRQVESTQKPVPQYFFGEVSGHESGRTEFDQQANLGEEALRHVRIEDQVAESHWYRETKSHLQGIRTELKEQEHSSEPDYKAESYGQSISEPRLQLETLEKELDQSTDLNDIDHTGQAHPKTRNAFERTTELEFSRAECDNATYPVHLHDQIERTGEDISTEGDQVEHYQIDVTSMVDTGAVELEQAAYLGHESRGDADRTNQLISEYIHRIRLTSKLKARREAALDEADVGDLRCEDAKTNQLISEFVHGVIIESKLKTCKEAGLGEGTYPEKVHLEDSHKQEQSTSLDLCSISEPTEMRDIMVSDLEPSVHIRECEQEAGVAEHPTLDHCLGAIEINDGYQGSEKVRETDKTMFQQSQVGTNLEVEYEKRRNDYQRYSLEEQGAPSSAAGEEHAYVSKKKKKKVKKKKTHGYTEPEVYNPDVLFDSTFHIDEEGEVGLHRRYVAEEPDSDDSRRGYIGTESDVFREDDEADHFHVGGSEYSAYCDWAGRQDPKIGTPLLGSFAQAASSRKKKLKDSSAESPSRTPGVVQRIDVAPRKGILGEAVKKWKGKKDAASIIKDIVQMQKEKMQQLTQEPVQEKDEESSQMSVDSTTEDGGSMFGIAEPRTSESTIEQAEVRRTSQYEENSEDMEEASNKTLLQRLNEKRPGLIGENFDKIEETSQKTLLQNLGERRPAHVGEALVDTEEDSNKTVLQKLGKRRPADVGETCEEGASVSGLEHHDLLMHLPKTYGERSTYGDGSYDVGSDDSDEAEQFEYEPGMYGERSMFGEASYDVKGGDSGEEEQFQYEPGTYGERSLRGEGTYDKEGDAPSEPEKSQYEPRKYGERSMLINRNTIDNKTEYLRREPPTREEHSTCASQEESVRLDKGKQDHGDNFKLEVKEQTKYVDKGIQEEHSEYTSEDTRAEESIHLDEGDREQENGKDNLNLESSRATEEVQGAHSAEVDTKSDTAEVPESILQYLFGWAKVQKPSTKTELDQGSVQKVSAGITGDEGAFSGEENRSDHIREEEMDGQFSEHVGESTLPDHSKDEGGTSGEEHQERPTDGHSTGVAYSANLVSDSLEDDGDPYSDRLLGHSTGEVDQAHLEGETERSVKQMDDDIRETASENVGMSIETDTDTRRDTFAEESVRLGEVEREQENDKDNLNLEAGRATEEVQGVHSAEVDTKPDADEVPESILQYLFGWAKIQKPSTKTELDQGSVPKVSAGITVDEGAFSGEENRSDHIREEEMDEQFSEHVGESTLPDHSEDEGGISGEEHQERPIDGHSTGVAYSANLVSDSLEDDGDPYSDRSLGHSTGEVDQAHLEGETERPVKQMDDDIGETASENVGMSIETDTDAREDTFAEESVRFDKGEQEQENDKDNLNLEAGRATEEVQGAHSAEVETKSDTVEVPESILQYLFSWAKVQKPSTKAELDEGAVQNVTAGISRDGSVFSSEEDRGANRLEEEIDTEYAVEGTHPDHSGFSFEPGQEMGYQHSAHLDASTHLDENGSSYKVDQKLTMDVEESAYLEEFSLTDEDGPVKVDREYSYTDIHARESSSFHGGQQEHVMILEETIEQYSALGEESVHPDEGGISGDKHQDRAMDGEGTGVAYSTYVVTDSIEDDDNPSSGHLLGSSTDEADQAHLQGEMEKTSKQMDATGECACENVGISIEADQETLMNEFELHQEHSVYTSEDTRAEESIHLDDGGREQGTSKDNLDLDSSTTTEEVEGAHSAEKDTKTDTIEVPKSILHYLFGWAKVQTPSTKTELDQGDVESVSEDTTDGEISSAERDQDGGDHEEVKHCSSYAGEVTCPDESGSSHELEQGTPIAGEETTDLQSAHIDASVYPNECDSSYEGSQNLLMSEEETADQYSARFGESTHSDERSCEEHQELIYEGESSEEIPKYICESKAEDLTTGQQLLMHDHQLQGGDEAQHESDGRFDEDSVCDANDYSEDNSKIPENKTSEERSDDNNT